MLKFKERESVQKWYFVNEILYACAHDLVSSDDIIFVMISFQRVSRATSDPTFISFIISRHLNEQKLKFKFWNVLTNISWKKQCYEWLTLGPRRTPLAPSDHISKLWCSQMPIYIVSSHSFSTINCFLFRQFCNTSEYQVVCWIWKSLVSNFEIIKRNNYL